MKKGSRFAFHLGCSIPQAYHNNKLISFHYPHILRIMSLNYTGRRSITFRPKKKKKEV